MSPKKPRAKATSKKKAAASKKKATTRKKAAAPKKKAATRKKAAAPKKKTAARKKAAAPKKKAAARKKTTAAKKKTAAPKKKVTSKKKAAASKKKSVAAKKKTAAPKKKVAVKKKAAARKPASKKPAAASARKKAATTRKMSVSEAKMRADKLLQGFGNFEPYKERKGEKYMNDNQVGHFRQILTAWKHALMEEVDRTVQHMQDEAANFPDPNDRASQESDFTMELRTRDRERKLIKKIEESIKMLDSEDYGFCESCGVEIGIRRLEARPTATLCIDCKTLDEIREKQKGG
jgi:DnaK suppressor protein